MNAFNPLNHLHPETSIFTGKQLGWLQTVRSEKGPTTGGCSMNQPGWETLLEHASLRTPNQTSRKPCDNAHAPSCPMMMQHPNLPAIGCAQSILMRDSQGRDSFTEDTLLSAWGWLLLVLSFTSNEEHCSEEQ